MEITVTGLGIQFRVCFSASGIAVLLLGLLGVELWRLVGYTEQGWEIFLIITGLRSLCPPQQPQSWWSGFVH